MLRELCLSITGLYVFCSEATLSHQGFHGVLKSLCLFQISNSQFKALKSLTLNFVKPAETLHTHAHAHVVMNQSPRYLKWFTEITLMIYFSILI